MPLEIEVNVEVPSTFVIPSKTIELISAIHLLTDSKHHQLAEHWSSDIYSKFTRKSKEAIKLLAGMRLKGIEIIEFILKDSIFDDISLLMQAIERYEDIEFIYTFLGEEVSIDKILEIKGDKQAFILFKEEVKAFSETNLRSMKELFYNTASFKQQILSLIRELDCPKFNDKFTSNKELYDIAINNTNQRLVDKPPLELAQEIMGRKFKIVYSFSKHYFVPSFFFSPHKIRFFNEKIEIIIFDISKYYASMIDMGDKLSNVLKLISDKTRLEILKELAAGSSYGKLLAEKLNLTTSTISHHLEQLKSINLVTEERIKNIKYFSANTEEINKVFDETKKYILGGQKEK